MNSGCTTTELLFDEKARALADGQLIAPPHAWPEKVDLWREHINQAALEFNISPAMIAAVIAQESEGNPKAGSYAGARGLMQIIKLTWTWLMGRERGTTVPQNPDEREDPLLNVRMGTKLLRYLQDKHDGNWIKTLASYNAGSSRCGRGKTYAGDPCQPDRWGLVTNCGYVDGVLGHYNDALGRGYSSTPVVEPPPAPLPPAPSSKTAAGVSLVMIGALVAAGFWFLTRK